MKFLKKRLHFFLSHDNIYKSLVNSAKQTFKNIEAWLSLVERCVRDAEVASSNLVASTYLNTKPVGQAVKTTPSHGVNPGSIPGQVMKLYGTSTQLSFFMFIIVFINRKIVEYQYKM